MTIAVIAVGQVVGHHDEELMRFPEPLEAHVCAKQTLAMLPHLRQWVSGRVTEAGACEGISLRQFAALRSIQEGTTSPGEMARLWRVTPAVITGILDRLERRHLVRREADSLDRRRQHLVLTDRGEQIGHNIDQQLTGALTQQLANCSPIEIAELHRSLQVLDRVFQELGAQLSGSPLAPAEDMPCWDDDSPELTSLFAASGERS